MAQDIRIKATLDDKVSGGLKDIQNNIKNTAGATNTFSSSLNNLNTSLGTTAAQAAAIKSSTGGAGIVAASLFGGAGGATLQQAAGQGVARMFQLNNVLKSTQSLLSGISNYKFNPNTTLGTPLGKEVLQESITGLGRLDAAMKANAASATSLMPVFKKLFSVIGAVVSTGAFAKVMSESAKAADAIDAMSQRLGVSVEEFQALSYASKILNVNIETISNAYRTLSASAVSAATGNKEMERVFHAIGVSVMDASGGLKSPTALFEDVIEAMGKLHSETARNAVAQKVLGRSYQELIPIINAGKEGMEALKNEAKEIGYVLSTEHIARLNKTQDAYERLGAAFKGIQMSFAAENANFMTRILGGIESFAQDLGKILSVPWLKMWESAVHYSAIGLKYLEAALEAAGTAMGATLISGIAKGMEGGIWVLRNTIGKLLPQEMQQSLDKAMKDLSKVSSGSWSQVAEVWKKGMDEIHTEKLKIDEIWAKDVPTNSTKKTTNSVEELIRLLRELTATKSAAASKEPSWYELVDRMMSNEIKSIKKEIEALEKRKEVVDNSITAYKALSDIAMKQVGLTSPFQEQKLRIASEEAEMYAQLEDYYRKDLISYEEYMRAKTQIAEQAANKQEKNYLSAFSTGANYASDLFSSISGLMTNISERQMDEVDRWQQREEDRIERSLMTEGQKQDALEKLSQQAEARKKQEFEEMKGLRLAEAIINTAAGVAAELGKEGVYGTITGALVAAMGAVEIASIAAETYAKGGIVKGSSESGDRVPARVNSGEMILTKDQQAELWAMANGRGGGSGITISAPININAPMDSASINALGAQHEKQLEALRGMIKELEYRGRL